MIYDGFVDAIGNTPLIKLRAASARTGCTILGKAEFLNPGGSVKDRAARAIIEAAEARFRSHPGVQEAARKAKEEILANLRDIWE